MRMNFYFIVMEMITISNLKNFYIFCGKSGSGKDKVINTLCKKYGFTKVVSYTTRPRRKDEEKVNTHIFVNQTGFNKIRDQLIAYTNFNSFEYGGTSEQVKDNDFYTLDVDGIKYFKDHYKGNKPFKIIYLDVPESVCKLRMYNRGDNKIEVAKRIANDIKAFKEAPDLADIIIPNDFFDTCVDEVYQYIIKCEKSITKGSDTK